MNILDPDPSKILNFKCFCKIGLPWKNTEILMVYPCEHMFHESCCIKDKKSTINCKLCNEPIIHIFKLLDKNLHPQRFADILSVSYYSNMSDYNTMGFVDSMFNMASLAFRLPFIEGVNGGLRYMEDVLSMNNLNLKVYGMEKCDIEPKKVFIVNHVTYFEMPILAYLFKSGFLMSSVGEDSQLIKKTGDIIPILSFDRGKKDFNVVDAMRDFVDKYNSICLFPEGCMKHPDTLIRFRSGFAHIGKPVYAVVIRYMDFVTDGSVNNLVYKLGSKKDLNVEVHILGPYYPPFSVDDIEKIRFDMAKSGRMVLSRVSNRDIID